jgi:hypothetical protein
MDTPKGRGLAILFRDYGHDTGDMWTVVMGQAHLACDVVAEVEPRPGVRGGAFVNQRDTLCVAMALAAAVVTLCPEAIVGQTLDPWAVPKSAYHSE